MDNFRADLLGAELERSDLGSRTSTKWYWKNLQFDTIQCIYIIIIYYNYIYREINREINREIK